MSSGNKLHGIRLREEPETQITHVLPVWIFRINFLKIFEALSLPEVPGVECRPISLKEHQIIREREYSGF